MYYISLSPDNLCFIPYSDELFSPMMIPSEPVAPTINVTKLIQQSSIEGGWDSPLSSGGVLSTEQTSKVLCGLSQEVDRYSVCFM